MFQLTTLEKEMRHDLLLDSGSGIQISMLDIDRYIVPEEPPALEPEDAALLLVSPSAPFVGMPKAWHSRALEAGEPHLQL